MPPQWSLFDGSTSECRSFGYRVHLFYYDSASIRIVMTLFLVFDFFVRAKFSGDAYSLLVAYGALVAYELIIFALMRLIQNASLDNILLAFSMFTTLIYRSILESISSSERSFLGWSNLLIFFSFSLTGLKLQLLLATTLIAAIFKVIFLLSRSSYLAALLALCASMIFVLLGVCSYYCHYCLATELLRLQRRPRIALADVPCLDELESVFVQLPVSLKTLSVDEHYFILFRLPQLFDLREFVLRELWMASEDQTEMQKVARYRNMIKQAFLALNADNRLVRIVTGGFQPGDQPSKSVLDALRVSLLTASSAPTSTSKLTAPEQVGIAASSGSMHPDENNLAATTNLNQSYERDSGNDFNIQTKKGISYVSGSAHGSQRTLQEDETSDRSKETATTPQPPNRENGESIIGHTNVSNEGLARHQSETGLRKRGTRTSYGRSMNAEDAASHYIIMAKRQSLRLRGKPHVFLSMCYSPSKSKCVSSLTSSRWGGSILSQLRLEGPSAFLDGKQFASAVTHRCKKLGRSIFHSYSKFDRFAEAANCIIRKAVINKVFALPRRTLLGRFTDVKIERWYLSWLNSLRARQCILTAKCLNLANILSTILISISYAVAIVETQTFLTNRAIFYFLVSLRLVAQPLVIWIMLRRQSFLSLTAGFDSVHLFSRRSHLIAIALILFSICDAILIPDSSNRLGNVGHTIALLILPLVGSMHQQVHFTLSAITLMILVIVSSSLMKNAAQFTSTIGNVIGMFFIQETWIVRSYETTYRRLFALYALPYLLYLDSLYMHVKPETFPGGKKLYSTLKPPHQVEADKKQLEVIVQHK